MQRNRLKIAKLQSYRQVDCTDEDTRNTLSVYLRVTVLSGVSVIVIISVEL